ncbi:MAG: D-alanyl-D-alanine carboxypeptidase family protein [Streptosporangiales bacterium]
MRRAITWRRRLAVLACVLALPGPLVAVSAPAAQATTPGDRAKQLKHELSKLKSSTTELRREAKKARTALTVGTAKWKSAKKKLAAARKDAKQMAAQARAAGKQVEKHRRDVAQVAAQTYQHPMGSSLVLFTEAASGGALGQARGMADLDQVNNQRANKLASFKAAKVAADVFAKQARKAKAAATKLEKRLHKKTVRLRAQAKKSTAKLSKAAAKVDKTRERINELQAKERKRLARIAAKRRAERASRGGGGGGGGYSGGGSSSCHKSSSLGGYSNGLIPLSALCPLPGGSWYLRADAATAFWRLNAAYSAHFGSNICVNSGYRSLQRQYELYKIKPPGIAAVPGTSNHGLGLSVDLGCGINIYGSAQFNWMKRRAPSYGFIHPSWAESAHIEAWHWNYTG